MVLSAETFDQALWWQTSGESPLDLPRLKDVQETDIAIIGGGFTGLSAALHLAERGLKVTLLEARHLGFGATGRNGGQVIPGLKYDPDTIEAKFPPAQAQGLIRFAGASADLVFDLIKRHSIDCAPVRSGWIQAAHSERALGAVIARARQWQKRGIAVELLDRAALTEKSGAVCYHGGWRDPRAGAINPLAYARGLARAASRAGASLHENSPVLSLKRQGAAWHLKTPEGHLRAARVIMATNAYGADLVPGLNRSLLPVQSMLLATEPLDTPLREKLMPGGVVLSETRKLAFYMRQSPDGRLIFGGRGAVGAVESPKLMAALEAGVRRVFPDLGGVKFSTRWSGHLALTMDGLPHLHNPAPGLHVLGGYNGRGIALASAFGPALADWLGDGRLPDFPVTPIRPIAWHRIREPVMNLGIRWYWLKDRLGFAS